MNERLGDMMLPIDASYAVPEELFAALLHKLMTGEIQVGEPGSNIRATTDV